MKRFIQLLHDNPETIELFKHPNEWALLSLIAVRATRTISNIKGLQIRQSLIGDYKSCGLTEQKYRTAKSNLSRWKIVTFKTTNKGTIATLCNDDIYNINAEVSNEQNNSPSTSHQRTDNEQITTNNKGNNGNKSTGVLKTEEDNIISKTLKDNMPKEYKKLFLSWLGIYFSIHGKMTEQSQEMQFKKLMDIPKRHRIQCLEDAIAGQWKNIRYTVVEDKNKSEIDILTEGMTSAFDDDFVENPNADMPEII